MPADDALPLGSVEFEISASRLTRDGVGSTQDGWSLAFERIVLGFKTMTIGKIGVPDVCAYRGRGADSDVVIDPRAGVVQTFNGIQAVECPDVGIVFGSPSAETTLGKGITTADLLELASGDPAHAIVHVRATRRSETLRIHLRFSSALTATAFGGCRADTRGVTIRGKKREDVGVRFAAENLFREAISTTAGMRVSPFRRADTDGDGTVTMDELDALPLRSIVEGQFYQLPNGTRSGSFADYLRALFRFTIGYRTDDGLCVGNDPFEE